MRRVRDSLPAGCLQRIPAAEHGDCEQHEVDLGFLERASNGREVRITDREPEKNCARSNTDDGEEHTPPIPAETAQCLSDVEFEAVVRELVLLGSRKLTRAVRDE